MVTLVDSGYAKQLSESRSDKQSVKCGLKRKVRKIEGFGWRRRNRNVLKSLVLLRLEIRCSIRLSYAPSERFKLLKLPHLVYRTRREKCCSRRTFGAQYRFHRRF
jgi:hypothetical protein